MFEIATEIAGDEHGFRFIQLPYNLAMPEALTLANEKVGEETMAVLETAAGLDVTVVVSASMLRTRCQRTA